MPPNSNALGQGRLISSRLARAFEFVALGVLLLAPPPLYLNQTSRPIVIALHIGLVLPLFWSRKVPEIAYGLIALVAFVQWIVYVPMPSDIALLIGLYRIASSRPLRHTLVAAGVLEFGVLLVVLGDSTLGSRGVGPGPLRGHIFDFIFLSGLTLAAAVLGTHLQTRHAYLREIEERAVRLEVERDQQAQLATAGERARVAREMHDIVAHNLAVMVALTDGAALTVASDPQRAALALEEASKAGRTAMTDMRRVLGILRDSNADASRDAAPHLTALDELLETVRHTGLDVRYRTSGPIQSLPDALQLSIYRIVQEALTNTMKHAQGAHMVAVDITVGRGEVTVVVDDDGSSAQAHSAMGHGLVGMTERATLHAGSLTAGPTNTGWRTEARLRINTEESR